jgi:hypothetical protein
MKSFYATNYRLYQFQCQREGTLFYYQHDPRATPNTLLYIVDRCPVCGSRRVKLTGREYPGIDEHKDQKRGQSMRNLIHLGAFLLLCALAIFRG